jgi:REase_DpnII-MboI
VTERDEDRFRFALAELKGLVTALPPDPNANRVVRYEFRAGSESLGQFIASGDATALDEARTRFDRAQLMLPPALSTKYGYIARELLRAADRMTNAERQAMADPLPGIVDLEPEPILRTRPQDVRGDELDVITRILGNIDAGLERWTWEEVGEGRCGGQIWDVTNERHVQNLLWLALAPAVTDLTYEEWTPSVGRRRSRVDIALPSLDLAIEVKFVRRVSDFAKIVEEVAADSALYTVPGRASYSRLIVFVWDDTRSSERHRALRDGLRTFRGVIDAMIVSRPARMQDSE